MTIPLSVPNLDIKIADDLHECIETGWVSTSGRFISEFEDKAAEFTGAQETVACQSGTAGLHTAMRMLDIGPGDLVIAPSLTFIAAVNPIRYMFADPVILGCDENFCIDPDCLEKYCRDDCVSAPSGLIDKASGKHVKALVVVHVFGYLADMERIVDICSRYGIKIIEDATEAFGCFWDSGRFAGIHAGLVGDIGVFSFNANKIITTGGGGMIVSRHKEFIEKARYLTSTAKDDALFFEHDDVGYNYRMLNIQAALGVSQIDDLPGFIETKKCNHALYSELLKGVPGVKFLGFPGSIRSNHWFYSLYVDDDPDDTHPGDAKISRRDRIMKALIEDGIMCRPVWKLIHKQKPYIDCKALGVERAEDYEGHVLNLPCSTNLSEEEIRFICGRISGLA